MAKVREVPFEDIVPGMVLVATGMIKFPREKYAITVNGGFRGNTIIYLVGEDGKENGHISLSNTPSVQVVNKPSVVKKIKDIPAAIIQLYTHTTAGADPEVFAIHADGTVIPAWEYLPSKTDIPHESNDYQTVYYDGFQAEFTTPPVQCHGYFTDHVRSGLKAVWMAAKKVDPAATLSIASALPIPRAELMKYDSERVALGCAPSRNVYGERRLTVPDAYELEWRFAGCHQHYGSSGITAENVEDTVRLLDAVVGVANVTLAGEKYLVRERRRYYGRAGEYRFHQGAEIPLSYPNVPPSLTTQRLEYRVPDTVVMCHPAIYNLFVDLARLVVKVGSQKMGFLWHTDEDEVRACINEGDVSLGRKILLENEVMLRRFLQRAYGCWNDTDSPRVKYGIRTLLEGVESLVGNPTDMVGNWMLDKLDTSEGFFNTLNQDYWRREGSRSLAIWNSGKWWNSAANWATRGKMV